MGSRPSKVAPIRSRSGLSFVSQSSVSSLNTIDSIDDDGADVVHNFKFDEVTIKSFRVSWDPPDDFDVQSYQVRLFPPDKIKSRTLLRALPQPSHTFKRLRSSTLYTVAVIGIDDNGKKSSCSTATVTTLPRPPRDLQFPSDSESEAFQVLWKHCKGRPGNYEVDLTPKDNVTSLTHVTGLRRTSHLFRGLVPGTKYTVSVRNSIDGTQSESITGSIMTAPRHIGDVTFSDVTQHEMTLKWKKPEGRLDSYTIQLLANTWKPCDPITIYKLTRTSYTFNGLVPGRLYNCKITCNVAGKESKPQLFTQCTVPCEVAGAGSRDIGPEEAVVTWTRASGDADDYDLFLTPKVGVIGETSPRGVEGNEYKFTGLVPGTTYTVGIVTNAKDKSSKRVVSTFATVPGMCGDLEVSQTERTCTTQRIKWPPASGRVDSYLINIRRDDKQDEGWTIDDIFAPTYLLNGLTPGTLYRVHVAAMRDGRESSSVGKVFGTVPSSVSSVFFSREQCSFDRITCAWEPSIGGVEDYHVVATCQGGVIFEATVPGESSDHVFTGLIPSTVYEFNVTAISNDLRSDSMTGRQITGPDNVKNLKVESTSKRELQVSWIPPDKGADNYNVKITPLEADTAETPVTHLTSNTEFLFQTLIPGSLYEVEVTSISNMINGKSTSQQTYTKPGDVMNVHVPADKISLNTIGVQWWGVEGSCKDVEVILTRLKKSGDDDDDLNPVVVKEEQVASRDGGSSEIAFKDLEPGTVYGIRLRAFGKAGVGSDAVFTQATLAPPEVEPETTKDGVIEPVVSKNAEIEPEVNKEVVIQPETSRDEEVKQGGTSNDAVKPETIEEIVKENEEDAETLEGKVEEMKEEVKEVVEATVVDTPVLNEAETTETDSTDAREQASIADAVAVVTHSKEENEIADDSDDPARIKQVTEAATPAVNTEIDSTPTSDVVDEDVAESKKPATVNDSSLTSEQPEKSATEKSEECVNESIPDTENSDELTNASNAATATTMSDKPIEVESPIADVTAGKPQESNYDDVEDSSNQSQPMQGSELEVKDNLVVDGGKTGNGSLIEEASSPVQVDDVKVPSDDVSTMQPINNEPENSSEPKEENRLSFLATLASA